MNMEEKKSMLKPAMNSGAITGIILIIYSLVLYFVGAATSKFAGNFNILFLAVFIFIFTKTYRDKECKGIITYGQSLGYGTLIGLFASIILAFFLFIELKLIDPSLVDKMMDMAREQAMAKGLPEEQFEKGMAMMKWTMTPAFLSFSSILAYTFFSFIISLITSIFIRNEK
jgi:hypothetical protein